MLKKLLLTWLIGIVPTLLFVLIHSFTGKYDESNSIAWQWFFLNSLPSIALVAYVFFKNSRSEVMLLPERKFKLLRWISVLYVLILLSSMLLMPFANSDETKPIEVLQKSYYWLMPFQLFFILLFSVAIFGKKLNQDEELFEETNKDEDYDPNDIHSLLAHNQLAKLFIILKDKEDAPLTELILLENRYNKLKQDRKEGIISYENAKIEHNQITYALRNLVSEI